MRRSYLSFPVLAGIRLLGTTYRNNSSVRMKYPTVCRCYQINLTGEFILKTVPWSSRSMERWVRLLSAFFSKLLGGYSDQGPQNHR